LIHIITLLERWSRENKTILANNTKQSAITVTSRQVTSYQVCLDLKDYCHVPDCHPSPASQIQIVKRQTCHHLAELELYISCHKMNVESPEEAHMNNILKAHLMPKRQTNLMVSDIAGLKHTSSVLEIRL